ncbi:CRISPR-associated protein Csx3 [Planktothrix sp. FACHB-1355]|uniref:CRISPR-associated protein Csx3 n=1 Tax=Aerosakkonema funiforme FACHB-1375 TaxID=2949571 RepID=A0A926ZHY4_9CYAN|nr:MULTISPECIES: CRISPR-associated ring nuclease Crn3/Csx3 [Oscillatoriales]MBD2181236.1 CRISPR-associated protein Csx3 [Aerosakkonema funiforme FACHB-1375]MBD3563470.1 CRISPR-associated protein Csx3 [Planktothrix sp. FACHB-1355]
MSAIQLQLFREQTQSGLTYQHLHIQINTQDGLIVPADLKNLFLPEEMVWSQGVVIEGKAPIWLYAYLVHACHPAAWVACFDPRLGEPTPQSGGAVVIATHTREVALGEVLKVNLPAAIFRKTTGT